MDFTDSAQDKAEIIVYDLFISESIQIKILGKYLTVLIAMAKMLKLMRKLDLETSALSGWWAY